MRFARSSLAIFLLALTAMWMRPANAQAQTFQFQVCNTSTISASVSISHLVSVGDNRFEVQGWWTVPAGGCQIIGTYPAGWFYYYAEQTGSNGQLYWGDNTLQLCVAHPGPFDRINLSGYSCQSSETLVGFSGEDVSSSAGGTFTWTLQ
jgi:uncharacterized membrane protein